jgi:hypothetical protein
VANSVECGANGTGTARRCVRLERKKLLSLLKVIKTLRDFPPYLAVSNKQFQGCGERDEIAPF